jgi:Ala-tRNA(Pro) deacylase
MDFDIRFLFNSTVILPFFRNHGSTGMSDSILNQIRTLLKEKGISYREVEHPPTFTSEESAAARGEELGVGAKALLLKTDENFRLFVMPADRKLDSSAIKRHLKAKKIRFATPEELMEMTGLVPGSVPPFGSPLLPFEIFGDEAIGTIHDRVAFNAGSLTHSIIMSSKDWEAIARPQCFIFAKKDDK